MHTDPVARRAYAKAHYQKNREACLRQGRERYKRKRAIILEQQKKYYSSHKETYAQHSLEWARKNPDKRRIYVQRTRHKYLRSGRCWYCGADRQGNARLCPSCREAQRVWSAEETRRLRNQTIDAYGGKCSCCGESLKDFLTLDHPKNDGAAHRKETKCGTGTTFYRWLRKRGYPKDFVCLCWNCNCGKRLNGGSCPHKAQTA
jgi:hypothetical protein